MQQGQDAILIAANDANAVCGPLKQAMAKGIKVVTYDSDAAPDCRTLFINQASSEDVGRSQVKLLADLIGHKGDIAILSATANATNQNTWIKYMKDELTKPEYKDMKLVKVAYGDDDDQKSFQQTQGLLQAYPNLKGIIAPTTVGISAGSRYISGSKYKGKVVMTGLGTPNQMREFVKDGTVSKFALWNPKDLGYLAGYAAAALASGQITGAEGEKFKAGKLGEFTIGKAGEVILGPPFTFDKSNINDFDF
jgi:rhamnose transport system substrate-binding protein